MVARGDLGVELELERVPFAQKLLIRKAKASQVPVLTCAERCKSLMCTLCQLLRGCRAFCHQRHADGREHVARRSAVCSGLALRFCMP